MAVSTDIARKVWGVGLAGGTKPRAQAAKMALCVALAKKAQAKTLVAVCKDFPEFAELIEAGGLEVPDGPAPAKKRRMENGCTW